MNKEVKWLAGDNVVGAMQNASSYHLLEDTVGMKSNICKCQDSRITINLVQTMKEKEHHHALMSPQKSI